MHEVLVPRLNPNDETAILVEWYSEPGASIGSGDAIALLETSKASVDLEAEAEGLLHIVVEAGAEPRIGEVIAYLFSDEAERDSFLKQKTESRASDTSSLTITKKARELIQAHGITEEQLLGLGKRVIKTGDVTRLVKGGPAAAGPAAAGPPAVSAGPGPAPADKGGPTVALSRHQVAVGRTVAASHREIPRAFVAVRVVCDALLEGLARASASAGVEIGLVEYVVRACARLRKRHQLFFGSLLDERTFLPAATTNVGITLDVGKGLFVPVVHDVESLSLADVARVLADYKFKAFRDSFAESELEGGSISVSLNTDADVVVSVPVIMPGQIAMVSLTAVIEEPWIADGALTTRKVTNIGVAYDHRVVNGADAVAFCKALKATIEKPREIEDA